jgi:hypothetical protein
MEIRGRISMTQRNTLIVFAKMPVLDLVKTRLFAGAAGGAALAPVASNQPVNAKDRRVAVFMFRLPLCRQ